MTAFCLMKLLCDTSKLVACVRYTGLDSCACADVLCVPREFLSFFLS